MKIAHILFSILAILTMVCCDEWKGELKKNNSPALECTINNHAFKSSGYKLGFPFSTTDPEINVYIQNDTTRISLKSDCIPVEEEDEFMPNSVNIELILDTPLLTGEAYPITLVDSLNKNNRHQTTHFTITYSYEAVDPMTDETIWKFDCVQGEGFVTFDKYDNEWIKGSFSIRCKLPKNRSFKNTNLKLEGKFQAVPIVHTSEE